MLLAVDVQRLDTLIAFLGQVPCQMTTIMEDCDAAWGTHTRHPERHEKLPRSEWCARCEALGIARDMRRDAPVSLTQATSPKSLPPTCSPTAFTTCKRVRGGTG